MVKGVILDGKRVDKTSGRAKSSKPVAKRNISKKELDGIKDRKRSEKERKADKKMQFLRAKQQKQRDERRKRFMPNITDDSKKDKKDSDDDEDEHAGEVYDTSAGILAKDGYYEVPVEHMEVTKEDEEIIKRLQKKDAPTEEKGKEMTLFDLIMQKMNQNQQKNMENYNIDELEEGVASKMNKKVVQVYRGVGRVLQAYRSGKFPKAFKVIPMLTNWEDVLFLTKPHKWTPQAMFEATKIFASNFNAQMAQRFYNLVLLPVVRNDIDEKQKLNYHYYQSVKKAVFKPNAFFKGFLLPLAKDCSAREAAIIGSILVKVSIPVLHASAALLKMSQYEYSIGSSYFIKVLLAKNFALPTKVIDGMVEYFYSF